MSDADIRARRDLLPELSRAARAIAMPLFETGVDARNKAPDTDFPGAYDPVTEADTESERVLRAVIHDHFPDDAIEGEELPDVDGTSGYRWTLDPIDGTRGFISGVPVWSTLIAVSREGDPVLGAIDLPALGRMAVGDNDAAELRWDTGRVEPLRVRTVQTLSEARLACTQPFGMFGPGELAAYKIIQSGCALSRLGLDALAYVLLAQGRMDLVIEAGMKPCDVRALMPVVRGAGGVITDWEGGSPADGPRLVACGSPRLMDELYTYLGRAMG